MPGNDRAECNRSGAFAELGIEVGRSRPKSQPPAPTGGTRENQYVKENGVWRIKSDHLYLTFLADYEKG